MVILGGWVFLMSQVPLYRVEVTWAMELMEEIDSRTFTLYSHGARPVHLIITMIKWIRTSRLSIKNSLYLGDGVDGGDRLAHFRLLLTTSQKCAVVPRRARI